MQDKRRDTKGRVLRNGEVQRPDGKYMFRYTDTSGIRRTVYSWKLVDTDRVPEGKRCDAALRDIEKTIQRDLDDKIKTHEAITVTVNQMYDRFMALRLDLKETTRCNYAQLYDVHVKSTLGPRPIGAVKPTQIQSMYMEMSQEKGLKFSTIQSVHSLLYQVFENAVIDNIIRTNPTTNALKNLRRKMNCEQEKRHALTEQEQAAFIDFVYSTRAYKRYGPLFTVLLGTGMRIGEALGLRWCDCDFETGFIHVGHTLSYKPSEAGGSYQYRVTSPKTKAGIRDIPMFDGVRNALRKEKRVRRNPNLKKFSVGEYTDFVFLNSQGRPWTQAFIFDTLHHIVTAYNKQQDALASKSGENPFHLPYFSAHILRHTFCTRICEHEADLKFIQEIMGHSNIRTTMDVYNEVNRERKAQGFKELEGKFRIA